MEDVLRIILHFYVMSSEKPKVLLTNDDGIESGFLRCLIDAFITDFEVLVCAPDGERSWIGHAISRNAKLKPKQRNDFPCNAYELNGTPADCVNLAIGNLKPLCDAFVRLVHNILRKGENHIGFPRTDQVK